MTPNVYRNVLERTHQLRFLEKAAIDSLFRPTDNILDVIKELGKDARNAPSSSLVALAFSTPGRTNGWMVRRAVEQAPSDTILLQEKGSTSRSCGPLSPRSTTGVFIAKDQPRAFDSR